MIEIRLRNEPYGSESFNNHARGDRDKINTSSLRLQRPSEPSLQMFAWEIARNFLGPHLLRFNLPLNPE